MEEVRFEIAKACDPKNVVVIGGGPSGMEAARVAALSGHSVTLIERNGELGGTMGDICAANFRANVKKLTKWYARQFDQLGVDVRLDTEVTGEEPILREADSIIVGCGTVPVVPPIPGIEGENVVEVSESHRNPSLIKGDRVVICGVGAFGFDAALEIADAMDKDVTVIETLPETEDELFSVNKIILFNQLSDNKVRLLERVRVVSITETCVMVERGDGATEAIPADTVITAFGMEPDLTTVNKIRAKYLNKTRVVGGGKTGLIGEAVREGYYAGRGL